MKLYFIAMAGAFAIFALSLAAIKQRGKRTKMAVYNLSAIKKPFARPAREKSMNERLIFKRLDLVPYRLAMGGN
jgi:hypothetical protein